MIITIDGPSGTGKSTVARLLAQKLKFSFFDTGAMYRAFSWWVQKEGLDLSRKSEWLDRISEFSFNIEEKENQKRYIVNGSDVTEEIRRKEITSAVSAIAAIKEVRDFFLPIQRTYAKQHDSVFEGRDLGSVVFPEADLKFFLTASPEIRGKRRYLEILSKNPQSSISLEEIIESLQGRDEQDSKREIAPLTCPANAEIIDTSNYEADEVVEILFKHVLTKKK